ncbi:MAG: S16 family serine protease [Candidatus Aenigmatarchaeota archaeon]
MKINRILLVYLFLIINIKIAIAVQKDGNPVTLLVPAIERVNDTERGVMAILQIYAKEGNGHIFIDTMPLTEIDTQTSARIAREVVSSILDLDMSNYDLFIVIRSDSPAVGGPSAGAAIAIGTIASLLNLSLNPSVIITGAINIDGTIGSVGGILEKARASAEHNATIFLIPYGQSKIQDIDIKEYAKLKWNLTVIEVKDVVEALKYMSGYEIRVRDIEVKDREDLKKIMKGIAENFMKDIEKRIVNLENKINYSRISYSEEKYLIESLKSIKTRLEEAKKYYEDKAYYTASSYFLGVGIDLAYLENLFEFYKEGKKEWVIENNLNLLEEKVRNQINKIEDAKNEIDSITDVEIISIAEDRIIDAKNTLREAWKNYYNYNYDEAIRNIAYISEREKTSEAWLSIINNFTNEKINFDFSELEVLCKNKISELISFIGYGDVLGVDTSKAKKSLSIAQRNLNEKKYSAALFNLITTKSEIEFALTLKSIRNDTKEIIKKVKNDAARSIRNAETLNVTPILALSYYEYGEKLEKTNSMASIQYFIYSKNYAKNAVELSNIVRGEAPKPYAKIEIKPVNLEEISCKEYFVIGISIGIVISSLTLILLFVLKTRTKKKKGR